MNRYIIKNCPCYCEKLLSHDFSTNTSEVADKDVCVGSISNSDYHCQDCTDCILKQIVELCNLNYTKYTNLIAKEILKRLDIQEVE